MSPVLIESFFHPTPIYLFSSSYLPACFKLLLRPPSLDNSNDLVVKRIFDSIPKQIKFSHQYLQFTAQSLPQVIGIRRTPLIRTQFRMGLAQYKVKFDQWNANIWCPSATQQTHTNKRRINGDWGKTHWLLYKKATRLSVLIGGIKINKLIQSRNPLMPNIIVKFIVLQADNSSKMK